MNFSKLNLLTMRRRERGVRSKLGQSITSMEIGVPFQSSGGHIGHQNRSRAGIRVLGSRFSVLWFWFGVRGSGFGVRDPERGTMNAEPNTATPALVINERASRVRLILFDVDGVLTDGTLLLHADGSESKVFDIKDGTGIVWAQRLGLTVGFLSARSSAATTQRAAQLGITLVHQGVGSKLETFERITDSMMLDEDAVAYMGDDILDLPVLARVGLAAAPADA
ncbi:MAG TPA: hypothetical protein VNG89_13905, partial [Vicinamibacterales bacterium]|nr:hypothetical protein [Vicinamibacterales bacterium]